MPVPLLACALCGLLLTFALPPIGWWPLGLAIFPLFALVARAEAGRRAFRAGVAFALPFFALYILWLPRSFAQLFGVAFWFVFPLLVAALAVFWGLTCWASWRLAGGRRGRAPGAGLLLVLPVAWVLVEWARTQGYFAFPWGTLGYAWLNTPAAQLAEFVGVYGLSLLVTLPAALLAWPWARVAGGPIGVRLLDAGVAAAAVLALLGAAFWQGERLTAPAEADDGAPLRALLVQGNVDPFARAVSAARELQVHEDLTRQAAASGPYDLVVWPEGAVLGYRLDAGDSASLRSEISATAPGAGFIVGGRAYEGGSNYNSLFSLDGSALLGRYDKEYLVPFGERWPFIDQLEGLYTGVFRLFGLPLLASTAAGSGPHVLPTAAGDVAAFICYESVFPQVQRAMVEQGAQVLVLATNDAWFGVGNGARQHFDMGRLRAIETRRWLLRAGNDGITAAVDPWGRVTAEIERHERGALAVNFGLRDDETVWVRYGAYAPLVLLGWLLLALLWSNLGPRRPAAA